MENGDVMAEWEGELQDAGGATGADAEGRPDAIRVGTSVVTDDGLDASIALVRDDGTFDLKMDDDGSPRLGVGRSDFTVTGSGSAGDMHVSNHSSGSSDHGGMSSLLPPPDHAAPPTSHPPAMEMHYSGGMEEEDLDDEYPGESEPDNELARLLSHLREFSELASMVSLQTTAQQGQASAGGGGSSDGQATAGPVLAVGDHVVLAPGAARTSDGSRGPLRRGDVGEVIEVGETHVRVRTLNASPWSNAPGGEPSGSVMLSSGDRLAGVLGLGATLGAVSISGLPGGTILAARPWWYLNSALAKAPAQDAAWATSAASAKASATTSPEADCAVLRTPLKDMAVTLGAVRRIVARLSGEGDDDTAQTQTMLALCNDYSLLQALAEGLLACYRPDTQTQLSGSGAAALESLLLAADALASALFLGKPRGVQHKDALSVGDRVKFSVSLACLCVVPTVCQTMAVAGCMIAGLEIVARVCMRALGGSKQRHLASHSPCLVLAWEKPSRIQRHS